MDWASYGFVVAAVEHRDGSAAYTYHLNTYPVGGVRWPEARKEESRLLQANVGNRHSTGGGAEKGKRRKS